MRGKSSVQLGSSELSVITGSSVEHGLGLLGCGVLTNKSESFLERLLSYLPIAVHSLGDSSDDGNVLGGAAMLLMSHDELVAGGGDLGELEGGGGGDGGEESHLFFVL